MIEIEFSSDVPDSTYFRVGDCEPDMHDGLIVAMQGRGGRRSWGEPCVNSKTILHDEDLISIHTGFFHKHGGGQFWRHYRVTDAEYFCVNWQKLNTDERKRILAGYEEKAPNWAKKPGKLRKDYRSPKSNMFMAYKVMWVEEDGSFSSLFNDTIYELGKTMIQAAKPEHGGGYYVYLDKDIKKQFLAGKIIGQADSLLSGSTGKI